MVDTTAVHFLEQLAAEVKELEAQCGCYVVLIAESDPNDPRLVRSPEVGDHGMDAQWGDDSIALSRRSSLVSAMAIILASATLADLAKAIKQVFVYDDRYSTFRRWWHGRPLSGLLGHRFLGYLQNHLATGQKASAAVSSCTQADSRSQRLWCVLFVPLLFQGEEWGLALCFCILLTMKIPSLARPWAKAGERSLPRSAGS